MTTTQEFESLIARVTGDEKHSASAHSTADVLHVLYDDVLRHWPERPDDPDRDRFYLSKGHGPAAYYAILAAHGYFPAGWLDDVGSFDSPLGWHPDRILAPGVEIASGSLGQGLPIAVGSAIGLRVQGSPARVFVLVGDGELDEGSNAEAIEYAAIMNLDHLTVIVIDNQSRSDAFPDRMGARFAANGWWVRSVDGRDHEQLRTALGAPHTGQPGVVIARVEAQR